MNTVDGLSESLSEPISTEEIRRKLFTEIAQNGTESLDGKYGIRLLLRTKELPPDMDCATYIFGNDHVGLELYKAVASSPLVSNPESLNLAVYGFPDDGEGIRHVGVVTPRLTVISKLNERGPVYEHPPEYVPMTYGPIEYRRIGLSKILERSHPSLYQFLRQIAYDEIVNQIDPSKTEVLSSHLSLLEDYLINIKPHEVNRGFQVSVFDHNRFVATDNYMQVVLFDQLPEEIKRLIAESGIPTFLGNIATGEAYQKKGVATALWKLTLAHAKLKFPSLNELIKDDSTRGYTSKARQKVNQFMVDLGYEVNELWSGIIEGRNTWLTNYQKK